MADQETRYDEKAATMWVYRDYAEPKTLVPKDELKSWVERKNAGETDQGKPLDRVNYVFGSEETAEYNSQPLSFSNIGVYTGNLDDPKKYQSSEGEPSFDTKKDFGIE